MAAARKAHVYRIYPTDDNDNITDTNVWLDVMRIDQCTFNDQRGVPTGATHQDRIYVVLWGDNTVAMGPSPPGPSRRTYEPLTVTEPSPGGDPTDPSLQTINIPLIKKTWFTFRGSPQGVKNQEVQWVFRNNATGDDTQQTGREATTLRITNNDLNNEITMPAVNVGDPSPQVPKSQQIDWADYAQALQDGAIDDSQYVDISVTDRFPIRFPPAPFDISVGQQGIVITYVMVNKQRSPSDPLGIEDLFQSPPDDSASNVGTNKPGGLFRTDPFQAIVNVSWGGLAVEFGDKAQDSPNDGSNAPTGGGS